jgi:DNA-binding NarL/FixJ family response regulator
VSAFSAPTASADATRSIAGIVQELESTAVDGLPVIEIVLADDHAMVRGGLRRLLDGEPDLRVVAEAGDVENALRHVEEHRPGIVVLDLNMPGTPTLPALPRFLATGVRIVVMTMQDDLAFAREALSAGANGYVLKAGAEAELVEAIRAAAAGRTYLDPALGARLATTPPGPGAGPITGSVTAVEIGTTFAGHRIDAIAGRGGMATVFRATDLTLDRPVALKLIDPSLAGDPVFRARFERECRLAAALDHPNVVQVFHAGEERGLLYVTMRYVDGTDLGTLLHAEGRLEPARAVEIVAQVADALDEAHRHGLIHRDVKPGNILLRQRGEREHAYLTDFGITKERTSSSNLTRTGFAMGTADYMAPEQAMGGEIDERADVYSLGCVLYRALTGELPFERASDVDTMWAHVHEPPPSLSRLLGLPDGLGPVMSRVLAKVPAERPATAGALALEARAALG